MEKFICITCKSDNYVGLDEKKHYKYYFTVLDKLIICPQCSVEKRKDVFETWLDSFKRMLNTLYYYQVFTDC